MLDPLLAAYLAFTFVLVITPGSATAVVIRNTISGGRRGGLATAAGAALGNTSHAAAAGLGLAVLIARWPSALGAVKAIGAAYLTWLGASSLWRALRGRRDEHAPFLDPSRIGPADHNSTAFREGLIVNLSNPAIVTFYLVVVPSFIPAGTPPWYFGALAVVHIAMAFVCHGLWTFAFDRVRAFLVRPVRRRVLEGVMGAALIGLALRVIWPLG